ncbi:MAG: GEVED domain-containing protein [Bacteroidota bacterium]
MNHLSSQFMRIMRCGLFLLLITFPFVSQAQKFLELMNDPSVNVYTVVQEAENYFQTHSKGKGSGWKPYQRWLYENESRYYPSGDRTNVDPYLVSKAQAEAQQNMEKMLFNDGWEELGPVTVGQITGHYSIGLGRVETFYVDPLNSQKIYLGSRSGGFWKTTNGGNSWQNSTDELPATGVNAITASPTNSDSVLINTRNADNGATQGIYRSVDGGMNWVETNFKPSILGWGGLGDNDQIFCIKYHPTVPNKIYIGTTKGLYVSSNNLATWTLVLSGTEISEIAFHPTNPNKIYVYDTYYWGANQDLIYVSSNGGTSFTASGALAGNASASCYLYTSPDAPNNVWVASSNGIWKSTDSGSTFSFIGNSGFSCHGGFAVSDTDADKILYGYLDLAMSNDGGAAFSQTTWWSLGNTNGNTSSNQTSFNTSTNYVHADLREAECVGGVFYAASDGFLSKSTDNGVNWEILSDGTSIRENYCLGTSQSDHYRTICGSQDNGTSIRHQGNWVEFTGGDGMEGIIHPLNHDYMMSSYQYGSHLRTTDGGLTSSGASAPNSEGSWVAPMLYDPNEQMRVYHFSDSVHRSEDFGLSWTLLGSPTFTGDITNAAIAENNTSTIVVTRNEFIEKSTDGGLTFASIKGTLPNYSITDVAFDPLDDNVIVVTYNRYQNDNQKVYISTDQGATWTNITANLGNMPVLAVVIDHTNASTIYLGTERGVYKKTMAAVNWVSYSPDLPNTAVQELEVMWGSNTLKAATWGRGLWEFTLDNRVTYPTILLTSITNPPTEVTPKETVEQFVTSTVTYDNTLTSVYVKWSVNTPVFNNTIVMNNISGNQWRTINPIPDYPEGTKIFFKVYAVGSAGDTTETYKFHYTVKPFEYCGSGGESASGNLYIKKVTLGPVINSTVNSTYTYYENVLMTLEAGVTYNIALEANQNWGNNDFGVWIDYNDDALFEASELILADQNTGNLASGNFTVPMNAILNDTLIMRIRLGYWDNPVFDPCGITLGEVEDYPIKITTSSPLSVELISFTANKNEAAVVLNWKTAAEIDNDYYTVERSGDINSWEVVGTVDGAGTSNEILNYALVDQKPLPGLSYYRLKQTDFGGVSRYSQIESVEFFSGLSFQLFPNPTTGLVSLQGNDLDVYEVSVLNNLGQLCNLPIVSRATDEIRFDFTDFTAGVYSIRLNGDHKMEMMRLILVK